MATDYAKYEDDSWGEAPQDEAFDYTLPSGKTVLLKKLDMLGILRLGKLDDLDFMSKALVSDDAKKPVAETEDDSRAGLSPFIKNLLKGDNFERVEEIVNTVCLAGIIAPKMSAKPADEQQRVAGARYIDRVPFADRLELFNVIFDSEGLSTFRDESADALGSVPDVTDVQLPAESPGGVE